jgi:diguanylate cyclase (GGDEF)-like protein
MNIKMEWEAVLSEQIDRVQQLFVTGREFNANIRGLIQHVHSPLAGLRYEVNCLDPQATYSFGDAASGPHDVHTFPVSDHLGTICRVSYWIRDVAAKPTNLDQVLESLFESFWKPALRTPSAGLPDLKRQMQAQELVNATVEWHAASGKISSILFCDLDNFKQVNTHYLQAGGDRVIKEFGTIVQSACLDSGIPLQNGGDEFVILMPGLQPEEALRIAFAIQKSASHFNFKEALRRTGHINAENDLIEFPRLGVSSGVATTREISGLSGYKELSDRADLALKEYAKKPHKGVCRFVSADFPAPAIQETHLLLDSALCLIKSSMLAIRPFANVWLNSLSDVVYEALLKEEFSLEIIRRATEEYLDWVRIDKATPFLGKCAMAVGQQADVSTAFSSLDCAFAVAHGIFHYLVLNGGDACSLNIQTQSTKHFSDGGLYLADGSPVWADVPASECNFHYDLGWSWSLSTNTLPTETKSARSLLIQIGHEALLLPSALFAGVIVVDDRPTSGGGLPDFWELTIAKLVSQVVHNPNIAAVYITGQHANGRQTVAHLRDVSAWENQEEQLAYKTGMQIKDIRQASKLLDGKVRVSESYDELVAHLSGELRHSHILQPISLPINMQKRFLSRPVDTRNMRLGDQDGCRVQTVAEAFPVVLDIARNAGPEEVVKDQAGQQLRELVDFKVHLLYPAQDIVPVFYNQEKTLLDEYFNKQFLDPHGLFGEHLEHQLDPIMHHVKNVIEAQIPFSSRRAILVIPNIISGNEPQPLGLVSIRIYPRFVLGRVRLHYSFTWRTVEALVGFPYSLYGSVCYGLHLMERIRNMMPTDHRRQIEMGELSYIAHSLHFFIDEHGQNIARKIVDEAST